MPTPHGDALVAPSTHAWPAGQVTHEGHAAPGPAASVLLNAENEPAAHFSAAVEPAGQYEPCGHTEHCVCAKRFARPEYVPAAHSRSVADAEPAGQ